jgi:serine protease Do
MFCGLSLLAAAVALGQPGPPAPPPPPHAFAGSFLGVGVVEIDADRAKELKLKEEQGVEVKSVEEDSPAAKAGIKVGDVVLDYNGQRVEGAEQFVRLVRETPIGRRVKLLVWNGGATRTVTAAIGSRSYGQTFSGEMNDGMAKLRGMQMPDLPHALISMHSRVLGVESESLSSQLADYFGAKDGGVLVRSVIRGSPADRAGLKAGDVITKVGDRKVTSPAEIGVALRSLPGVTAPVTVVRNQKEMTITVTLDEKPSRGMGPARMAVTM